MKNILAVVVVVGVLMTFSCIGTYAQGEQPTQVDVTLTDFNVAISNMQLPANTPIRFTVTNNGAVMHEMVLEKAGMADSPMEMENLESKELAESEIEDIDPGTTRSATWVLAEPGEYQLACHVPGHYEKGMVMKFTVMGGDPALAAVAAPAVARPAEAQASKAVLAVQANKGTGANAPGTLPVTGGPAANLPLWLLACAGPVLFALGTVLRLRTVRL
jgi:uncharacterized cupredoxin-like copper-binding protein